MKELSLSELFMVSGGQAKTKPTRAELEKECRDDMNMGAGMGLAIGTTISKGNPLVAFGSALLGMVVAVKLSPECQALSKDSNKENKTGDNYSTPSK